MSSLTLSQDFKNQLQSVLNLDLKLFIKTTQESIFTSNKNEEVIYSLRQYARELCSDILHFLVVIRMIILLLRESDQCAITNSFRSCRPSVYLIKMEESR